MDNTQGWTKCDGAPRCGITQERAGGVGGGVDSVHRDADVGGGVIRVDAGCHGFFVQVGKLFTKCVHGFLVEVEAPDAA